MNGPPFKSSTNFCTTRNKNKHFFVSKNVAVLWDKNLISSWRRKLKRKQLKLKKTTFTTNSNRSMSSFSEWENRKKEILHASKLNKKKNLAIANLLKKSGSAVRKKKQTSVPNLNSLTVLNKKWRLNAHSKTIREIKNAIIWRKCLWRMKSTRQKLKMIKSVRKQLMFRRRKNTFVCLISRSKTARENLSHVNVAPKNSWITWPAM